jgi:PKD repeat protein
MCPIARRTISIIQALGEQAFFWDFGNGQTSTAANPTVVFTQPGQYRVKMVALDPNTCNVQDSGFFTINVSGGSYGCL